MLKLNNLNEINYIKINCIKQILKLNNLNEINYIKMY